jgi:hypothetical protein
MDSQKSNAIEAGPQSSIKREFDEVFIKEEIEDDVQEDDEEEEQDEDEEEQFDEDDQVSML